MNNYLYSFFTIFHRYYIVRCCSISENIGVKHFMNFVIYSKNLDRVNSLLSAENGILKYLYTIHNIQSIYNCCGYYQINCSIACMQQLEQEHLIEGY